MVCKLKLRSIFSRIKALIENKLDASSGCSRLNKNSDNRKVVWSKDDEGISIKLSPSLFKITHKVIKIILGSYVIMSAHHFQSKVEINLC